MIPSHEEQQGAAAPGQARDHEGKQTILQCAVLTAFFWGVLCSEHM